MEPTSTDLQKWLNTVSTYDNEFKKWEARTTKIIRRYRDDNRSQTNNESAKFNILWSNIQTITPAVYARLPKAEVSRRFSDSDPVGRVASQLIERALDFEVEHYPDFRSAMTYAVEDRFLGGRGVAWVRYEPHVREQEMPEDGLQVTEDTDETGKGYKAEAEADVAEEGVQRDATAGEVEPQEEIEYECAPTDYVHWKDFGHSVARTWEEVTCVWRWVYMTREALIERFGKKTGEKIPYDAGPDTLKQYGQTTKQHTRAKICELWDKDSGKVFWFSKSMGELIDERDDPLELEQFFPCAKPLYATMTSDTLVPVPDFVLYQDQAVELDILSDRIDGLVKSLRVRGVYDASQPALQRLLTEGDNNTLIPVDKWMAFGEKGGLKGSIDLLPLDTLSNALLQCYRAREEIKAQIYEITGLSDIIRGSTMASETATAQQIKGQYASIRLRAMQEDVALFATELLRLKAQIICTKFQPQTILMYAAAQQMQPADQQLIPQALQLMKDNPLRNFRIEVAADSLVQLDDQQMKRDRVEFIQAFGGFLREALPVAQASPEATPMLIEVMKFGVAAFKQAKPIEGALDAALEQLKQKQAQPQQPPPPDPEMIKIQAQQQLEQAKMQASAQADQMRMQADAQAAQLKAQIDAQLHQSKLQADMQLAQMQAQLEDQKMQHEMAMKAQTAAQEDEFNRWKAELEAATKVTVARIGANPGGDPPLVDAITASAARMAEELGTGLTQVTAMQEQLAQTQNDSMGRMGSIMQALTAKKRIIRGPDGRAVGIEIIQ
ncbi:MAG: hypothetical protein EXR85_02335 [Xanthomonadales bacterium]|nr:hypothetical protein [Xanthomonadales bacterium]